MQKPIARPRRAGSLITCLALLLLTPFAGAQQEPPDGMQVGRVEFRGLQTINEGFVRGAIKTREGQAYSREQVQDDIRALQQTRKFVDVTADALIEGDKAVVVFSVFEKPEIRTVEIDGNKRFTDDELFAELAFAPGSVLDRYEVLRGRENLLRKYQEAGHFYAEVELDEDSLRDEGRVIYTINEGPRVRVRRVEFEGLRAFPELTFRLKLQTRTYFPIFRTGAFDEQAADRDAVEMQAYYRAEGYLDARVGYRLQFDEVTRTDLTVIFVIEEGPRYRVDSFLFRGAEVFDEERLRGVTAYAPGDFVRDEVTQLSIKQIEDLYGEIGYVDARARITFDYLEEPGLVRVTVDISEGSRARIGRITIRGNLQTKDEVVRRELLFYPREDFNTIKTREAERRLLETGLFSRATVSPLPELDDSREALVEVEEGQTVDFLVGVGVSTDSGVLGTLTINNRNFDLFDWPRTWGEFFRGRAFRGDGQTLRFQAEPGTEVSRFRISFTEPYFLDRPIRFDTSVYLFQRGRDAYDEERLGFTVSASKRFIDGPWAGWAIEGALRFENVAIDNLRYLAANDIRDAKGNTFLTSLKGTLVRDTTDSRLIPSRGYRFSVGWEQVGALGGDATFGRASTSFAWFKTMRTDLLDRKSVLGVRGDLGYIAGDAPVFERFFGGGFGSIRGFDYRGVSPRAGLFTDRVGGDFIALAGAEYSVPLYANNVRGVAFLDMGTVEEDFQLTTWRASVGFGLRVNLNFFGPVPFVLDFGWPIAQDDDDDTRVFNFSFGASF